MRIFVEFINYVFEVGESAFFSDRCGGHHAGEEKCITHWVWFNDTDKDDIECFVHIQSSSICNWFFACAGSETKEKTRF